MLHRLCGPPSIPLSFNLAAVLPRRCAYCVCGDTEELGSPTSSTHRLRRGLPGYLILFAPHAFAPQRQSRSRAPPSPPVFFPISTNFTSTLGIPRSSPELQPPRFARNSQVEPGAFTRDQRAAYAPFTPSKSEQRSPPSYYRGCWHEVSRGFFSRYRHHRRGRKSFTTLRPSSLTRHCWIRLAPIVQYSPLLPPVGVWAVSQSQCG